jgi:hypothetical protein
MRACDLRDTIAASEQVSGYPARNAIPSADLDAGPTQARLGGSDGGSHGGRVRPSPDSAALTKIGRGLIAAAMINAATILIVRRRRSLAVRAVVCV